MTKWYIKEFSKLTNISVRTLHHYDHIDLLKPSIRLPNGYRLYSEADLLKLELILALKTFGFDLPRIKELMAKNINPLTHLRAQKKFLQEQISNFQDVNHALDLTIHKLEIGSIHFEDIVKLIGEYNMRKELYFDIDSEKQKKYEQYWLESGHITREQLEQGREKFKHLGKDGFKKMQDAWDIRLTKLTSLLEQGLQPDTPAVQAITQEIYDFLCFCWTHKTPDKESFTGLGNMYCENSEFRKFYDAYHPQLAQYLAKAMKIFADSRLS